MLSACHLNLIRLTKQLGFTLTYWRFIDRPKMLDFPTKQQSDGPGMPEFKVSFDSFESCRIRKAHDTLDVK